MERIEAFDLVSDYQNVEPEIGVLTDDELQPITAGYGHCKSCTCTGFVGEGGSKTTYICQCGHHFTQHRSR